MTVCIVTLILWKIRYDGVVNVPIVEMDYAMSSY